MKSTARDRNALYTSGLTPADETRFYGITMGLKQILIGAYLNNSHVHYNASTRRLVADQSDPEAMRSYADLC